MNGTPIELMDGDTSFIYTEWIEQVLLEVKHKMQTRYNATKGFVTSIMGLQSSGKSTLLNTQYNLKFAVAAGRCTKGIFMLPVILSDDLRKALNDEVHFMLLFDTEGLRAQELGISKENRMKDGEMATACVAVADITCINSMNFQNSELFEILSVVVNMVIRYKKDNTHDNQNQSFDLSAVFINQGVSDSQYKAIDLGITVRQKDLNRMTQHALQRIGAHESQAKVRTFTEIIKRALDE
jgi:tRNA U34 5-carboxymethylaminomethyl modifying GTPase MnmE/TrmE